MSRWHDKCSGTMNSRCVPRASGRDRVQPETRVLGVGGREQRRGLGPGQEEERAGMSPLEFQPWLLYLLAGWPQASFFTSLVSSFFICQTGVTILNLEELLLKEIRSQTKDLAWCRHWRNSRRGRSKQKISSPSKILIPFQRPECAGQLHTSQTRKTLHRSSEL